MSRMKNTASSGGRNATSLPDVIREWEDLFGEPKPPARCPPPLDMLIATILSQNTSDVNSHRAYARLRKTFKTWEDILSARKSSIVSAIRTGGMADQKSIVIKETLAVVKAKF